MKTYGVIYADGRKELVSIVLDENENPRLDTLTPYPTPEDWVTPTIVPLVKLDPPADSQSYESTIVWYDNRVERQWVPAPTLAPPPAPTYTAEEWIAEQGFGGNRPTTLLYQKMRLDAAAKSSPKLAAVQQWLDSMIAMGLAPAASNWPAAPHSFEETLTETLVILA